MLERSLHKGVGVRLPKNISSVATDFVQIIVKCEYYANGQCVKSQVKEFTFQENRQK